MGLEVPSKYNLIIFRDMNQIDTTCWQTLSQPHQWTCLPGSRASSCPIPIIPFYDHAFTLFANLIEMWTVSQSSDRAAPKRPRGESHVLGQCKSICQLSAGHGRTWQLLSCFHSKAFAGIKIKCQLHLQGHCNLTDLNSGSSKRGPSYQCLLCTSICLPIDWQCHWQCKLKKYEKPDGLI